MFKDGKLNKYQLHCYPFRKILELIADFTCEFIPLRVRTQVSLVGRGSISISFTEETRCGTRTRWGKKLFYRLSFGKREETAEKCNRAPGLGLGLSIKALHKPTVSWERSCLPVYGAHHLTNVPLAFYFLGMSVSHIKMRTTVLRKDRKSSLVTTHFKII